MQLPFYSLDKLHLFPSYATREEYRAAIGKDAPPYDPARPPKNWFDPAAPSSVRRSIIYPNVLAQTESGRPASVNGKPLLDALVLSKEDAARVNIFEHGLGHAAPTQPVAPVPLRDLKDNEELVFTMPGVVMIRDASVALPVSGDQFGAEDRRLLRAIADKLGVR